MGNDAGEVERMGRRFDEEMAEMAIIMRRMKH